MSIDIRKAFDIIGHKALPRALRSRRLPEEYISLISILYGSQRASVNRSSEFPVQRGVKKGDTLSAIPNTTRNQTMRHFQRNSIQWRLGRCLRRMAKIS